MKMPVVLRTASILAATAMLLGNSLNAQTPDRSAPPEPGALRQLVPPAIERFTLSNGLDVLLVQKHQVPLVHVHLFVRTGSVDDPPAKEGLASLTADMLDEGAGSRDAFELADALDMLGASLGTGAELHFSGIRMQVPSARLAPAMDLFADVLLRPRFDETDMERLRARRLTAMLQAFDNPNEISAAVFRQTLYGKSHPYGRDESAESVSSLSRDDVRAFHAARFRPDNAALVVVGAVTAPELRPVLEKTFASWVGKGALTPPAVVESVDQVQGVRVHLVDKPGAAQSVIAIGRIGVPRLTEDYYTLQALNTVLGGSFTSRLNANLREDKGYTYGAGSSFEFLPYAGPFMARSSVQTEVTGAALVEFMKELRGMLEPVPAEELERAKNYVALQYPRRFETTAQIAGQVLDLVSFGLPDAALGEYVNGVLSVTSDQVLGAARRVLDPDNLAITVVGDRSVVESQIREAGFESIRNLSVEDVLGPLPASGRGAN